MTRESEPELLLVEDNANDAELTLRAVRRAIPTVRALHLDDGVKALDYLLGRGEYGPVQRARIPKLVLLDLKLPRIDGIEVLRQLRACPELRTLPVVLYSSSRELRDVNFAYAEGANSYVVKPVNFEAFLQSMAQVAVYWLTVNETPDPFIGR